MSQEYCDLTLDLGDTELVLSDELLVSRSYQCLTLVVLHVLLWGPFEYSAGSALLRYPPAGQLQPEHYVDRSSCGTSGNTRRLLNNHHQTPSLRVKIDRLRSHCKYVLSTLTTAGITFLSRILLYHKMVWQRSMAMRFGTPSFWMLHPALSPQLISMIHI